MLSSPLAEGFHLCEYLGQTLPSHLLPWACRSQSCCSILAWLLLYTPSVFFNYSLCNVYCSEKTGFWWSVKPFYALVQKAWLPVSISSQPTTELSKAKPQVFYFGVLNCTIAHTPSQITSSIPLCQEIPNFKPWTVLGFNTRNERQKLQGGGTLLSPTKAFVTPLQSKLHILGS